MLTPEECVLDSMHVMDCATLEDITRDINTRARWDKTLQSLSVSQVAEAMRILAESGKIQRAGDDWEIRPEPPKKPTGQQSLF
jgi:hypothetical protein